MRLVSPEDITRLNARMDELKDYLTRIEVRVDATYTEMSNVRGSMTTRADLDNIRVVMANMMTNMATSNDVNRLWGIYKILIAAILTLLVGLIIFILTKQPKL